MYTVQDVQKVPVRLNIFLGKIIITEVKVIFELSTRNSMVTLNLTFKVTSRSILFF